MLRNQAALCSQSSIFLDKRLKYIATNQGRLIGSLLNVKKSESFILLTLSQGYWDSIKKWWSQKKTTNIHGENFLIFFCLGLGAPWARIQMYIFATIRTRFIIVRVIDHFTLSKVKSEIIGTSKRFHSTLYVFQLFPLQISAFASVFFN